VSRRAFGTRRAFVPVKSARIRRELPAVATTLVNEFMVPSTRCFAHIGLNKQMVGLTAQSQMGSKWLNPSVRASPASANGNNTIESRNMSSIVPTSPVSGDAQAMMMYAANQKSMVIAYVLWFLLGWLGAHLFYVGKVALALIRILVTTVLPLFGSTFLAVLGILVSGVGLFLICTVIAIIWWVVDAFLIPGWIREHNTRLAAQLSGLGAFPLSKVA
jgi:TM2 domain-containing membrane protein YozV